MSYTYTFIIPHHNSPELLNRCLESIPVREDIQIIVVDDNSQEDKRPTVIRKNVEIIYIDAAHTKGAGHARNVGLSRARGHWLLFADCDDFYTDSLICVLDRYCNQDIDVLYFNYMFLDSDGKLLDENRLQKCIKNYSGSKTEIEYIKYKNYSPWAKMVKREYVLTHNMYFEEVPNGNDALFSFFVASYTENFAVCPEYIYCYIKTTNSISTKTQTLSEIQCRIDHIIKHSAFDEAIGLNDKTRVLPYLFTVVSLFGCRTMLRLMPKTVRHLLSSKYRNEWCAIIQNHQ